MRGARKARPTRLALAASVSQRSTVIKGFDGAAAPASLRLFTPRRAIGERNQRGFVTGTDETAAPTNSAEAVETLVWLLETNGVDRRRYRIVNRLRSVRDSDEFATLPEDLRARVREIVAESER